MDPLRRLFRLVASPRAASELPLREVERRLAKEHVKRRLAALYPELRGDPEALERAYHELDLEPRGVVRRPDGELRTFGLRVDAGVARPFEQG